MSSELEDYAQENAQKFWKEAGESHLNRGFPLSSGSRVIDVGGYKGDWTAYITRVHDCYVDVYEPLYDCCVAMKARFAANPKIRVMHYGLEDRKADMPIAFMEDSSTLYSPPRQDAIYVPILDASKVIDGTIDLLALNCEGSEYKILKSLIASEKIKSIRNLLIQFHTFVDDAKQQREDIREILWKTHRERWCYPFVWEAWSLNWRSTE